MRVSEAGLALIRRAGADGGPEYLAQWNDNWQRFALVGGHREPGESFRACCVREVGEELGLAEGADFAVAPDPFLPTREYTAYSVAAGAETRYRVELFATELLHPAAVARVDADRANRWLTESEIRRHCVADGRPVAAQIETVFKLFGVIPPREEYDLFVSYARKDDGDGWVTAFVAALQRDHREAGYSPVPLRVFYDRHEIADMDDWRRRLADGLRSAKVLLAVLSDKYLGSEWCGIEFREFAARLAQQPADGEAYATAVVVPPEALVPFGQGPTAAWLDTLLRYNVLDASSWREAGRVCFRIDAVRERLGKFRQQIARRVARAGAMLDSPNNLPAFSPAFVGRDAELDRVRDALGQVASPGLVAVHGIGGIGKTSFGYRYAHRFAEDYPGGRWTVNCAGKSDLPSALYDLGREMGLNYGEAELKSAEAAARAVRGFLAARPPSLVILDNVESPNLFDPDARREFLPDPARAHVLVTTRDEPPAGVPEVPLDGLPVEYGVSLLRHYRDFGTDADEAAAARGLAERLGGHPLALEIVGVYLWNEPDESYRSELEELEEEGIGVLDAAAADPALRGKGHEVKTRRDRAVSYLLEPTLWKLSPEELRALEFATFLPAAWVSWEWLRELVAHEFRDLRTPAGRERWERQIVPRLVGWRLMARGAGAEADTRAIVHPVIQDVVRKRLADRGEDVEALLIQEGTTRAAWLKHTWLERANRWEVEPVYRFALRGITAGDTRYVEMTAKIANTLLELGRYKDAYAILQRACALVDCDIQFSKLISLQLDLATGRAEYYCGHYTNARKRYLSAIELVETLFGPDRPELAVGYAGLGSVERTLGNFAEARRLYRRAIEIKERHFGTDHPDLAFSYTNLGGVERDLGDLAEARRLYRRAIEIGELHFGTDHPTLADIYVNLGEAEHELGDLAEARRLYRRAIEIGELHFDTDHPRLAVVYVSLGAAENALGNLAEARRLYRRAIEIEEKHFGADHPELAIGYSNLGGVESYLGDLAEARRLFRRAIEIEEKHFDPEHPGLANSYWNLGMLEQREGNLSEAITLVRRSYRAWRNKLGPDHRYAVMARNWLVANDPAFDPDA